MPPVDISARTNYCTSRATSSEVSNVLSKKKPWVNNPAQADRECNNSGGTGQAVYAVGTAGYAAAKEESNTSGGAIPASRTNE